MNTIRILTGLTMILKMLLRRRIVLIALALIPIVFLSVVHMTASPKIIPFRLASLDENIFIEESQKVISMVFFSCTATGFLVSFLALNLIQIDNDVNKRLIICGSHPFELLLSNLFSLIIMTFSIALYIGLLIRLFVSLDHLLLYILGLTLMGFVYGCYGLAVGTLIRGKLEGVFFIVMLANIDAGWLQNPMYYAEAQNNVIIRYLPAYFPSQSAIIAAFTDYSGAGVRFSALIYGAGFLIVSLLVFYNKMRIKK
jgi:hypothetical protein